MRRNTRGAPSRRAAGISRPLSGPTKTWPPDATASAARAPPTPGSTTAQWTVPGGNAGAADQSRYAPARMSWRGTSCEMSTNTALPPAAAPFIAAGYGDQLPKSDKNVSRRTSEAALRGRPLAPAKLVDRVDEHLGARHGRRQIDVLHICVRSVPCRAEEHGRHSGAREQGRVGPKRCAGVRRLLSAHGHARPV